LTHIEGCFLVAESNLILPLGKIFST